MTQIYKTNWTVESYGSHERLWDWILTLSVLVILAVWIVLFDLAGAFQM